MGQSFIQTLNEDGNSVKHVSIGQTRNSQEEWITPVAFWEKDADSALYLPPGESSNPKAPRVELKGSVMYDENTTGRTINAGASLVLGVYEFPATHRKYSVAYRSTGGGGNHVVEVLWGQSSSTFSMASNGNVFAAERPTLHDRSEYQFSGTAYERWTDAQLPARARYAQISIRNTHETASVEVRRTLVMLEPTFGV